MKTFKCSNCWNSFYYIDIGWFEPLLHNIPIDDWPYLKTCWIYFPVKRDWTLNLKRTITLKSKK